MSELKRGVRQARMSANATVGWATSACSMNTSNMTPTYATASTGEGGKEHASTSTLNAPTPGRLVAFSVRALPVSVQHAQGSWCGRGKRKAREKKKRGAKENRAVGAHRGSIQLRGTRRRLCKLRCPDGRRAQGLEPESRHQAGAPARGPLAHPRLPQLLPPSATQYTPRVT